MTEKPILRGLRTGLVFGLIMVFLFLIGFTDTGANLVAKLLGNPTPTNQHPSVTYYAIFMALYAAWCGSASANRTAAGTSLIHRLGAGTVGGFTAGAICSLTGYIFGTLNQQGIDPRAYLVALSPQTIQLFLFNAESVASGALTLVGVMTAGGLLGAVLAVAWKAWVGKRLIGLKQDTGHLYQNVLLQQWKDKALVRYALLALLAAALLILPRAWGSYWNYVLGTVGIYIVLGLGLNIITGLAGQLVIGYVAFFGLGAYTFALLSAPEPHQISMNFWIALVLAVVVAAVFGFLLGLPILNLRGDYLAIVTMGFGEIVRILLKSDLLTSFTGGPKGVRDIGGPTLFGRPFNSDVDFMYLIIIAVLVIAFLANRLQRSRVGRAWEAVREDETVARATGINAFRSKILALTISAAIAGLAGVLFASRNQFTGPEDHSLLVSINVICLVIVGGIGSIPGIILGAFALKGLPEVLREVESFRMLAFGALLVLMMNIRPEGFWPASRPKLENQAEEAIAAVPAEQKV